MIQRLKQAAAREWAQREFRRAKTERGATQADLGKALNISQPQAQRLLSGGRSITIDDIPLLEQFFGARYVGNNFKSADEVKSPSTVSADLPTPAPESPDNVVSLEAYKHVPEYGIEASAGGGALIDDEHVVRHWPFDAAYLAEYIGLTHLNVAIVQVRGDSMEPTLRSGSRVMVDLNDIQVAQPGVFVIYDGGGTVIKRVERVMGTERLKLISDNKLHTDYEVVANDVHVAGRVVWKAERI